jgi:hypothetical protein
MNGKSSGYGSVFEFFKTDIKILYYRILVEFQEMSTIRFSIRVSKLVGNLININ